MKTEPHPLAPEPQAFEIMRRTVQSVSPYWRTLQVITVLSTVTLAGTALISQQAVLLTTCGLLMLLCAALIVSSFRERQLSSRLRWVGEAGGALDASPLSTQELNTLRAALDWEQTRPAPRFFLQGLLVLPLLSPFLPPPVTAGLLLACGAVCLSQVPRLQRAEEVRWGRLAVGEAVLRREDRDGGPDDRPRAALSHAA